MSDETTLLQSLSKLKKAGKLRYWRGTIEIPESELHAICDEIQAEHDQAIAATLTAEQMREAIEKRFDFDACTRCGAYNIGEYYDGYGHRTTQRFCPNCGKAVKR